MIVARASDVTGAVSLEYIDTSFLIPLFQIILEQVEIVLFKRVVDLLILFDVLTNSSLDFLNKPCGWVVHKTVNLRLRELKLFIMERLQPCLLNRVRLV